MISTTSLVRLALLPCLLLLTFLLYMNAASIQGYVAGVGWRKDDKVPRDKVVVMGKLQREDTSWVQEHLTDWQHAIYTVDNENALLSTPRNKGKEANPYLLYIIQNYHALPSTIAFLHSHRNGFPGGWHTDAPGRDNVVAIKTLNIDFIQQNGYANMRCQLRPGCPDQVQPFREPDSKDPDNFERHIPKIWSELFGEQGDCPEVIATPCCAQFAVSKEQVLKRPLEEYKKYHQWLMDTTLSDGVSGRIFEYLWHIIFGQDPIYCPDLAQCYRDVYQREYNATEWEMETESLIAEWNRNHMDS